ncbi:MAG: DUF3782 domain-containing protein [Deltaproteobacteria bacterium]|nr:DUF3782 domain-containing protein [Deltaproteobacteria bacterium]
MAQQELRKGIQEVWDLFRDTDRRMKETDRLVKETSEQVKQTSRKVEQLNETVNALTGKWGKFVEGLVAPGAVRMFKEQGIDVERASTRNKIQKNGEEMKIDVMLENEKYIVAIEVKSTLKVEDVNEHIENLRRLREFFPRFKAQNLIGAVARIVIEEEADKYAYRKGLFVIGQTGETVKILNDEKFKPKVW